MKPHVGAIAIAAPILVALVAVGPALAQKAGGILRMYNPDSPASMSIHEEATVFAEGPMMECSTTRHV
jgi:peptide/nickel transport system substrate-binding protein